MMFGPPPIRFKELILTYMETETLLSKMRSIESMPGSRDGTVVINGSSNGSTSFRDVERACE